jgi:hypothetical protein
VLSRATRLLTVPGVLKGPIKKSQKWILIFDGVVTGHPTADDPRCPEGPIWPRMRPVHDL